MFFASICGYFPSMNSYVLFLLANLCKSVESVSKKELLKKIMYMAKIEGFVKGGINILTNSNAMKNAYAYYKCLL